MSTEVAEVIFNQLLQILLLAYLSTQSGTFLPDEKNSYLLNLLLLPLFHKKYHRTCRHVADPFVLVRKPAITSLAFSCIATLNDAARAFVHQRLFSLSALLVMMKQALPRISHLFITSVYKPMYIGSRWKHEHSFHLRYVGTNTYQTFLFDGYSPC